ncbi:dethiobiotin synthase [Algicola sagamiensis]|uniref:dethiobiotin synthase n=1 Tax=Algicola sagamiensis TaxID=163869 RepID=UPI000378DA9C|nr:dethiobiotin synthase [Algicola sagamiensis]
MSFGVFISGTDTDCGKTRITCGLLEKLQSQGKTAVGLKPISAGCQQTNQGLRNTDALALMDASSTPLPYETVNPLAFEPPIAPHIAAEEQQVKLSISLLNQSIQDWSKIPAQFQLIEGAGGWLLPLNQEETLADWVVAHQLPIILVVGMKLGCLNHALLTVSHIKQQGGILIGWIANHIDPHMQYAEENYQFLKSRIDAPCLGRVPYLNQDQSAADYIQFPV